MRTVSPSMVTEEGSAENASVRPVLGAPMETRPRSLNSARMRPLSRTISSAAAGTAAAKARMRRTGARPGGRARFAVMALSLRGMPRL